MSCCDTKAALIYYQENRVDPGTVQTIPEQQIIYTQITGQIKAELENAFRKLRRCPGEDCPETAMALAKIALGFQKPPAVLSGIFNFASIINPNAGNSFAKVVDFLLDSREKCSCFKEIRNTLVDLVSFENIITYNLQGNNINFTYYISLVPGNTLQVFLQGLEDILCCEAAATLQQTISNSLLNQTYIYSQFILSILIDVLQLNSEPFMITLQQYDILIALDRKNLKKYIQDILSVCGCCEGIEKAYLKYFQETLPFAAIFETPTVTFDFQLKYNEAFQKIFDIFSKGLQKLPSGCNCTAAADLWADASITVTENVLELLLNDQDFEAEQEIQHLSVYLRDIRRYACHPCSIPKRLQKIPVAAPRNRSLNPEIDLEKIQETIRKIRLF